MITSAPSNDTVASQRRGASESAAADPFLDRVIALLPALRAFGYSLCGDAARAEDLTQETFIKAHLHRAQFRTSSNLKAWLFTILRNCHFSEMRRRRRFEMEDPDSMYAMGLSFDPNPTAGIELAEISKALQRLPRQQREVLMLVHLAGLPYDEVADMCGVAVGTVKSRIARARGQLTTWLGAARC